MGCIGTGRHEVPQSNRLTVVPQLVHLAAEFGSFQIRRWIIRHSGKTHEKKVIEVKIKRDKIICQPLAVGWYQFQHHLVTN
jgi:hypothetical protein